MSEEVFFIAKDLQGKTPGCTFKVMEHKGVITVGIMRDAIDIDRDAMPDIDTVVEFAALSTNDVRQLMLELAKFNVRADASPE